MFLTFKRDLNSKYVKKGASEMRLRWVWDAFETLWESQKTLKAAEKIFC